MLRLPATRLSTRQLSTIALRRTVQISQHLNPTTSANPVTRAPAWSRTFSQAHKMSSPNNNHDFKLANLFTVGGRVAVISGGGSGIGLMCTQALAVNGAKVYIIGRTLEKLQTVAETYGKDVPGSIHPIQGDISDKESIKKMYEEIKSKEKHVDILINNAGISSQTLQTEAKSAEEMSQNLFHDEKSTFEDCKQSLRSFEVMLLPAFYETTHRAAPGPILDLHVD